MTYDQGTRGFILDCFPGHLRGRAVVYAVGRLETGETFGLLDDRRVPTLYVRAADAAKHPASRATELKALSGEPLRALTAATAEELKRLDRRLQGQGLATFGGGSDFALGYLMEHGLRGSIRIEGEWRPSEQVGRAYHNAQVTPVDWEPDLRILALDIETNVQTDEVLAVSLVAYGGGQPESEEVLVVGPPSEDEPAWIKPCADEAQLLQALAARVRELDPDVLTGWNVVDFDLPVLIRRFAHHGLEAGLARTRESSARGDIAGARSNYSSGQGKSSRERVSITSVRGRQVLDALRLVRSSLLRFDDLRLGTVADALLGRGKTLQAEEWDDKPALILASYRQDRTAFCAYCLEDSRLVRDILRKERLIELTVSRSRLIGLPLAKTWGSVASFEFIYGAELRRRGRVAPSWQVERPESEAVPGGLVLEPEAGLHPGIFVFDFKSLYPSIIRTFNIDPLAHAVANARAPSPLSDLTSPSGARFDRERGILPEMLDRFFVSREQAKAAGDTLAAYAYKIIMNSFYGVLGTDNCRYASPALAGSITGFGHELLLWTKAYLEGLGHAVLYGDTDSLFVESGLPEDAAAEAAHARGEALAEIVNQALAKHLLAAYGVESRLTLEFEKYYRWLLLPRSRGGGGSRAKSYAGLKQRGGKDELEIVGMEAVRSDWTKLARSLQRELLGMLFAGTEAEAMAERVRAVVADVAAGRRDAELVYRKQIRRPLSSYTSTTPPHVKAARLLPRPTRVVRYLMTNSGPQPLGFVTAPVDYGHYVEKQIAPIVHMLAEVAGFDAALACRLPGKGGGLFGD